MIESDDATPLPSHLRRVGKSYQMAEDHGRRDTESDLQRFGSCLRRKSRSDSRRPRAECAPGTRRRPGGRFPSRKLRWPVWLERSDSRSPGPRLGPEARARSLVAVGPTVTMSSSRDRSASRAPGAVLGERLGLQELQALPGVVAMDLLHVQLAHERDD